MRRTPTNRSAATVSPNCGKRAGIKGICPLKIRTFSGPYASEAYNSIRQSPPQEGIVLRINATEKSISGISKRQKNREYFARGAEYTQHQPTVHNPIGRLYARIYRKIHDFASDRRIPTAFAAVSPTLVLPSYPPQKHIKKGPALNRAGPAIQ